MKSGTSWDMQKKVKRILPDIYLLPLQVTLHSGIQLILIFTFMGGDMYTWSIQSKAKNSITN
jgi:hypothetical protein